MKFSGFGPDCRAVCRGSRACGPFLVSRGAYMAGSWRDILAGASGARPRDRGRARSGPAQQLPAAGPGPQARPPAPPYSAAEARGLIERELAALADGTEDLRPAPAPARPPEPRPAPHPGRPADARPASPPQYRQAPTLLSPVDVRPAPPSARPAEYRTAPQPPLPPARQRKSGEVIEAPAWPLDRQGFR